MNPSDRRFIMPIIPAQRSIFVTILMIVACVFPACVDPADRRPGTWLSGEPVAGPITNWSFTDEHPEIFIQVSTPYLIPHSVTIVCATVNGGLIVGARDPGKKRWPAYIESDAEVRLKIGDRIYDQQLELVEDPQTIDAIVRAYAAKYNRPVLPLSERPVVRYWRVVDRGQG
jgi:hypothetical protein